MPPQAPSIAEIGIPLTRIRIPAQPKSLLYVLQNLLKFLRMKNVKVNITTRRLIHMLVLILAGTSVLRLLRITISTYSSKSTLSLNPPSASCNSNSSACRSSSHEQGSTKQKSSVLTSKEYRFLADLITQKAPCNLLIFGLEPGYLVLSEINAAGSTIILEDDPDKLKQVRSRSNSTKIHKIKYKNPAGEAYKLLDHARRDQACAPNSGSLEESTCELALKILPRDVYRNKWDVVLVDGPRSDAPEAPGRMDSIYSASLIARAGDITNVLVHDVDRTIEKWFAWEFLCEENLVSSKGRFWNFKVAGAAQSKSASFLHPPEIG